jgi:uncharacterized protein YjbJ (UPF0337 family)
VQNIDRVRKNTSPAVNAKIDRETECRIRFYSTQTKEYLNQRLHELDREWDIERIIITQASTLAFTGLMLGVFKSKRWFALPGIVLPFLFMHGVQGWCPPVPVLRRLGVRTRSEIDCEKFAIKVLRGDFDALTPLVMNKDIFEGKWLQLKGGLKQWWGKLTDDEIEQIGGSADKLIGKLQEKYGWSRDEAEKEVDSRFGVHH